MLCPVPTSGIYLVSGGVRLFPCLPIPAIELFRFQLKNGFKPWGWVSLAAGPPVLIFDISVIISADEIFSQFYPAFDDHVPLAHRVVGQKPDRHLRIGFQQFAGGFFDDRLHGQN